MRCCPSPRSSVRTLRQVGCSGEKCRHQPVCRFRGGQRRTNLRPVRRKLSWHGQGLASNSASAQEARKQSNSSAARPNRSRAGRRKGIWCLTTWTVSLGATFATTATLTVSHLVSAANKSALQTSTACPTGGFDRSFNRQLPGDDIDDAEDFQPPGADNPSADHKLQ